MLSATRMLDLRVALGPSRQRAAFCQLFILHANRRSTGSRR